MDTTKINLQFDVILDEIASLASAELVVDALRRTTPVTDIKDAEKLMTKTSDALFVLASHRPDLAFYDISKSVEKARVGATLSLPEFIDIKGNIACLRSLKSCVENSDGCDSLKDITAWVRACDGLEKAIGNTVENENEVKDSASEKLYSLRRAIVRANAALKSRLDSLTRRSEISKYLQDNIVTIRGGRYVVPVKAECRSGVKGLVHDVSATGSTVFIEPFAIVEANNELRTLKTAEQNEIERILYELSLQVAENANDLIAGQRVLVECGVIFAKAEYAKKINAFRPNLNNSGRISLVSARHPLISPDTVVPVDIIIDKKLLLISGPNTGGKTVVLKTVGLFALMAECGIFLPTAENSEMSIFGNIFCDIGDAQSIEQSLSTFSAHIKNISSICSEADGNSLVLLDEPGDGTDPEEGAALAVAIIGNLLKIGATSVVTTHFNSVKQYGVSNTLIKNACMQFDSANFRPTYKLLYGVSGSSYALEIAEKLGLDEQIIAEAKSHLSAEKVSFDNMMREAEQLRNDAQVEKALCEKLAVKAHDDAEKAEKFKAEYQSKLAEIKENARILVKRQADEYAEYADSLIDEIKQKLKSADEKALFEARKIAKHLSDGVPTDERKPQISVQPVDPKTIKNGMRVFVSGLNKEGIVAGNPRGEKVIVAIGAIKTELPVSSLSLIDDEKKRTNKEVRHEIAEPKNIEVMLLGRTVDEAIEELERILSDIPPHSTIRIVHGKGTGALGKGIQNFLRKEKKIKEFRYGRYGEGDTGVTIAVVK